MCSLNPLTIYKKNLLLSRALIQKYQIEFLFEDFSIFTQLEMRKPTKKSSQSKSQVITQNSVVCWLFGVNQIVCLSGENFLCKKILDKKGNILDSLSIPLDYPCSFYFFYFFFHFP